MDMNRNDATNTLAAGDTSNAAPSPGAAFPAHRRVWGSIRARILGGIMLVLPIFVTFWVVYWLYSVLERYVIDPVARFVLWNIRGRWPKAELPPWFESYAAPLIGILVVLLLLYFLGFFVQSRLRLIIDWVLLRVPGVSVVYNGVRQVLRTLERQGEQSQRPQRVVLLEFPHPGIKVPAFVTASCRDVETRKTLLCVYVPTTPVPTSGYFLLVPEESVVELDWGPEQALQAIISGGLTVPPEVRYFAPHVGMAVKSDTSHANAKPVVP